MKDFKTWIYHETKNPKVINQSDYDELYHFGWRDTPAAFLKLESLGIEKHETEKAQQALEMVSGIVESLNGSLNIDQLNKKELEDHIKEHFGVDLDRRKTLKVLRKEAKALYDNSTTDN
tara:strand:- start:136 stop:492 length:357 start_codon:yes stop_codon:yes gene_type:complete